MQGANGIPNVSEIFAMKLPNLVVDVGICINGLHEKLHIGRVVGPVRGWAPLRLKQAFIQPEFDLVRRCKMFVQISQVLPFLVEDFMDVKGGVDIEVGG